MLHHLKRWRWLLAPIVILAIGATALAQPPSNAVGVYYIGPNDAIADAIRAAAPHIVQVDRPSLANVLVLNNTPLDATGLSNDTQRYFTAQIQKGSMGLVLFSGGQYPREVSDLGVLLGVSTFGMAKSRAPTVVKAGDDPDPLKDAIAWNSAPVIMARTVISNPNLLDPIVVTHEDAPLLQRMRGHQTTQVFLVGMWLGDTSNEQWKTWPYLRYLVYRLVAEAGGDPRPLSFASYPGDPLPQGRTRQALLFGGGAMLILAWGSYFFARRYVFLHPQASHQVRRPHRTTPQRTLWDQAGFHRPLAGFLALMISVLFLFPYLGYRLEFLPVWLLPWGQPLTFWAQVGRWAIVLSTLIDFGVGYATVYYFVQLWGRRPKEAFHYLQFYIWWQLLSGMLTLGITAIFSALVFPSTSLAHLTYLILLQALFQFPGFLSVFILFFRAIQRQYEAQILTLLWLIGTVIFQSTFALLLRRWGANTYGIGEALGGLLGLGLGTYASAWLIFIAGLALYNHHRYTLRGLLLPDFTTALSRQVLRFGASLVLGDLAPPLGMLIIATQLPGWIATDGSVYSLADVLPWLTLGYTILARGLYDSLYPALIEARSREYKTLLRYYVSQGLHYGAWFSLYLLAVLSALGPRFFNFIDRGVLPQPVLWQQAIFIWAAFRWVSWSADRVLIAAGHPLLRSLLNLLEQGLSVGGILYFTPRIGAWGIIPALWGSLLLKNLLAWGVIRREIVTPRFLILQSGLVPAGASLLIYNLLTFLPLNSWNDIWLSIGGVLITLPLYAFLTALLGGWEEDCITELQRAAAISGIGRPYATLIALGVRGGARLSPLHRREPVALYEMAEEEAWALTQSQRPVE